MRAQEVQRPRLLGNWERLSDGRVVIEVRGIRLSFPSEGSDVQLVTFSNRSRTMTLQQVIASPADARSMFSQSDLITVRIPVVTSRNDLWLGKFDRWQFRTLSIEIAIGGTAAVTNCEAWERDFRELRAGLKSGDPRIEPDEWAEFVRGKSPVSRVYIETQTPAYFLGITCNQLNTCYVPKCLSTNVGLSYSFTEAVHGRASWRAFNVTVQNVLKSILVDLVR